MAFEREDVKSTLILIKEGNKVKFSGLVRNTDTEGTTWIRLTQTDIGSVEFDDCQIINKPSSEDSSDIGLTHYSGDYSLKDPLV
jgi:hypothetical protein